MSKSTAEDAGRRQTLAEVRLPRAEYLPDLSVLDRIVRGENARRECPLDIHARWRPRRDRLSPIALLKQQAKERDPELVPLRHGRMSVSPFAFLRGSAAIMARDLAETPVSGLKAQLCGDAHLLNFGVFETPERSLVFGLNDFDETLPGPFEWDVKRLAASMQVAARELGHGKRSREATVLATVRAYREAMQEFASMRNLAVWHARMPATRFRKHMEKRAGAESGAIARKKIEKALTRDHLSAFDKLVETEGGELRFVSQPPLVVPVEELIDAEQRKRYVEVVQDFLHQYRRSLPAHTRSLMETYRFMHMARKVVGIGSVGTRTWVALLVGRESGDPLILQLKEAQASVLAPYAGSSRYRTHGRRVVEGQRIMQSASDEFLGSYRLRAFDGRIHDFYVRQLWDGKASIKVEKLDAKGLAAYGEMCGWTLARAHARSGDRLAIAAYLGDSDEFDRAVAEFAANYARVNADDHARLLSALAAKRLR